MTYLKHSGKSEIKYALLLITLIVIVTCILYKDFLLGKKLYIYTDQGMDTLNSYWPFYGYMLDAVKTNNMSFWLFAEGLGNSIFANSELIFDPFNILFLLYDKTTFAYALIYVAALKIIFAGLFFYLYLSCFNISHFARIAGALLYAFNGYMILWGQHYQSATILVFVPLLLYAYENLIVSSSAGIKILFSGIIAYLAIFSLYFFYIISIYLLLYSTIRWLIASQNKFSAFALKPFLYYVIGVGIGSVFILPCLHVYLTSPRITFNNTGQGLFSFYDYREYVFLFLRFFSNKLYFGTYLYSDDPSCYDPSLYSGIISLIFIPQLFYFINKRQKIILSGSLAFLFFSLGFPFFSSVMNAFSAIYFRWSFIIIVTFITLFCLSLDYVQKNNKINICNLKYIVWTLVFILSTIFLFFNPSIFHYYIIVLLIIYFIIFNKISLNSPYFKTVLLILITIEIVAASYGAINNRDILDQTSLKDKRGYFDYTNEAVAYLQHQDKTFYRVGKSYLSVFLRDPLMQNYKGVTAYNSLNNPGTIDLLQQLDITFLFSFINNIPGFDSRQIPQTLVGVKYFLAKTGYAIPFGYEYLATFGDVQIYRNKYYLPLGFTYDTYITLEDFNKLPSHQKDEALLKAFVINDSRYVLNTCTRISEKDLNNYLAPRQVFIAAQDKNIFLNGSPVELYKKISRDENSAATSQQRIPVMKPLADESDIPQNAKVQLRFILISPKDMEGRLYLKKEGEAGVNKISSTFSIKNGWWKYYFGELSGSDIFWSLSFFNAYNLDINFSQLKALQLYIPNAKRDITLKKAQLVAKLPQDMAFYVEDIKNLKKNTMQIRTYSNDFISGDITLDKDKLLFLSIPYDKGWQIKVDGKQTTPETVNVGFMGIFLNKGFHTVELKYTPPLLMAGIIMSFISIIVFLALILYQKRLDMIQRGGIAV